MLCIKVILLKIVLNFLWETLPEKCAYLEFFWFVFSPNAGKCGPKKL